MKSPIVITFSLTGCEVASLEDASMAPAEVQFITSVLAGNGEYVLLLRTIPMHQFMKVA